MNHRDPFSDSDQDRTVLDETILTPIPVESCGYQEKMQLPPRTGPNRLENAATPLLALMISLKKTLAYPDVEGLRSKIIKQVKAFKETLEKQGVSKKTIDIASYILCTAVDDVVLNNTAWGSKSFWLQKGLLATLHEDTKGGEKFFQHLVTLRQGDLFGNRDLLELMYICLALGFQGRYRNQYAELEEVREHLFKTLYGLQRGTEPDLSPDWQGTFNKPNILIRYVPFWVVAAIACALLISIYSFFLFRLNDASDPVRKTFSEVVIQPPKFTHSNFAIQPPIFIPVDGPPTNHETCQQIQKFLKSQVDQKQLDVKCSSTDVIIRIRGDSLFESGSAELNFDYHGLLQNIADAIKKVSGQILVTGHTDKIPIRTLKFPSNWKLSKARAETVKRLLIETTGQTDRFTAKGEADTKPLCSNQTLAGRACNRRVEIILMESRP